MLKQADHAREAAIELEALVSQMPSEKSRHLAELQVKASHKQAKEFREEWWSDESRVEDLRSLAIDGFEVLGTNAESAVPQLTKLFRNAETSFDAARALTKVGPKGFSVLTNARTNPKDPSRAAAIWWLREAPVDAKTMDSLLIQRLTDKDDVNRHNAAQFLAGKDAAAIPALIKMLDEDTNYLAVDGAAGVVQVRGH